MTDQPRSPRSRRVDVPDQADAPLVWDADKRQFVERDVEGEGERQRQAEGEHQPLADEAPHQAMVGGKRDQRRYFVPPSAVGKAPPGGTVLAPPQPSSPQSREPQPRSPQTQLRPGVGPGLQRSAAPVAPPAPPGQSEPPVPPGSPGSPGQPGPPVLPAARPTRRFRLRWRWVVLVAIFLPVLLVGVGLVWANAKFSQIERVDVASVLDPAGSGTNYLIVGSDSREGITSDDPNAGAILGPGEPGGQRADTIMLLRVEKGHAKMLSIPRDLFVTIADTGSRQRINAAYNGGPTRLIKTVKDNLGIPVNRYLEVDFVTFAGLVDAVGGVSINFPHPATDDHSGLNVQQTGMVELDGSQALAYVRSRHYTEIIDGRPHTDPTADLGRVQRQQQFLRAVLGKAGKSRNPLTLMKVGSSVVGGLRIDNKMSLFDALRFAWNMGKLAPESVVLPTEPFRTNGGAAVLRLKQAEADPVLAQFH